MKKVSDLTVQRNNHIIQLCVGLLWKIHILSNFVCKSLVPDFFQYLFKCLLDQGDFHGHFEALADALVINFTEKASGFTPCFRANIKLVKRAGADELNSQESVLSSRLS